MANELVVEVEFKNIECVPDVELTRESPNINVEIIEADSINQVLDPKMCVKGVVSSERKKSQSVHKSSSVNLWANSEPDRRYWLCERCGNGNLVVMGCLNRMGTLLSFADICRPGNSGAQWVTVFMEKNTDGNFTSVDDDSILVFLKLHDSVCDDYSYLGHRIVPKSMRCCEFLTSVTETVGLQYHETFDMFLEMKPNSNLKFIANQRRLLEKCGVESGSVIILGHRVLGQFPGALGHLTRGLPTSHAASPTSRLSGRNVTQGMSFGPSQGSSTHFNTGGHQSRLLMDRFVHGASLERISPSKDSSETVSSTGRSWLFQLAQSNTFKVATGLAIFAIISVKFFKRQISRRQPLQLQLPLPENDDFWTFLKTDMWYF